MSYEAKLLGPWVFRDEHGDVAIPAGKLRELLASSLLSANQVVAVNTLLAISRSCLGLGSDGCSNPAKGNQNAPCTGPPASRTGMMSP